MKLNLGCGQHLLAGYVNVDKYGSPDVKHDLETFPWPWPDSSVDEFMLHHALEHLGATYDVFISIVKEIYRTGRNGAAVKIVVPHPRHDDFMNSPDHVRPITAEMMSLFSKRACLEWKRLGCANSPLALHHEVDFEMESVSFNLEEPYKANLIAGRMSEAEITQLARERNNIIREIGMQLRIVK
jgi:predicted SAM-dependent methyltransferase